MIDASERPASLPPSKWIANVAALGGPLDVDELLYLICVAALDTAPGAEHAGITIADHRGGLDLRVATHPLVDEADALQRTFAEGPCIDVLQGRWQVRTADLRADVRWPRYGPHAARLGIVSQMGITLVDEPEMIAALNLYSSKTGAFDDDVTEDVMVLAIQAAHTLGRLMTQKQVADAMITRTTIGQATGILMERFGLTAARAFELLTRTSHTKDETIEQAAARVLEGTAGFGDNGHPSRET